jgi:hypothetical protein
MAQDTEGRVERLDFQPLHALPAQPEPATGIVDRHGIDVPVEPVITLAISLRHAFDCGRVDVALEEVEDRFLDRSPDRRLAARDVADVR